MQLFAAAKAAYALEKSITPLQSPPSPPFSLISLTAFATAAQDGELQRQQQQSVSHFFVVRTTASLMSSS